MPWNKEDEEEDVKYIIIYTSFLSLSQRFYFAYSNDSHSVEPKIRRGLEGYLESWEPVFIIHRRNKNYISISENFLVQSWIFHFITNKKKKKQAAKSTLTQNWILVRLLTSWLMGFTFAKKKDINLKKQGGKISENKYQVGILFLNILVS